MLHYALLTLLSACTEPPKDEPVVEDPYTAPDYAGCTYEQTYDQGADGTDDWTVVQLWDDAGRAVSYALDYLDEDRHRYIDYTYDDAGCLVEFVYEDLDETGTLYRQTAEQSCDEHGSVERAEYEQASGDDEPRVFTYEYTNLYEGDVLVEQLVELSFEGAGTVTLSPNRYTWSYDDAGLLEEEAAYDEEVLMSAETWTWLAEDKPLTWHYASDTRVGDESWEYDAHDREIAETYEVVDEGERTAWATSREWDEAHYRVVRWVTDRDIDGTDDATNIYDCEGDWPWSCDVTVDGSTAGDPAYPHDGEVDHTYTYGYTCD